MGAGLSDKTAGNIIRYCLEGTGQRKKVRLKNIDFGPYKLYNSYIQLEYFIHRMKSFNVYNFILTICVCEGTEQVEKGKT